MNEPTHTEPTEQQAAPDTESPDSVQKVTGKSSVKTRNLRFLGASLTLVVVLISLVAGIMLRQPKNSQSEVKQKEYNEEFNSLTPSTTYINPSQDEREALDSITIDEVDTEFNTVDKDLKNL